MPSGPDVGPDAMPDGAAGRPDAVPDVPSGRPEETSLVTRAIAGDQQAFEQLRAASEHVVRGTIRMQVGRSGDGGAYFVDHALVDDLVQVAWVQIWQKLPTYNADVAGFSAETLPAMIVLTEASLGSDRWRACAHGGQDSMP